MMSHTRPNDNFSLLIDADDLLPVRIAGVEVSPASRSWLLQNVKNKQIRFKPLHATGDHIDSVAWTNKVSEYILIIGYVYIYIDIHRVFM